jgi:hypothetical protein
MKRYLLIISLFLSLGFTGLAQNPDTDFVVLDFSCQNFVQLKAQYEGQPNTLILEVNQVMPPDQISAALIGKNVTDLHIFVWGKPGSMVFSNLGITSDNIEDYASTLGTWAAHVSGQVVIHSPEVFTTELGLTYKNQLEQLTGLNFIVQ